MVLLAPVAEEIFFRAFFYRALRAKLSIWLAATITGRPFASVHLQYYSEPALLLIIAGFGIGQCLLYERTGSLFAVMRTPLSTPWRRSRSPLSPGWCSACSCCSPACSCRARWAGPRARCRRRPPGALALVLHSHMPYVEGFGT